MRWFREYSNRINGRSTLRGNSLKAVMGACIYITLLVSKVNKLKGYI